MPASLPTESAVDKAVNEFGIGTYDSDNGNGSRGEDDEDGKSETSPHGDALPGTHGLDPFGPDRMLSYPQTFSSSQEVVTADGRVLSMESYARELADRLRATAADMLPGDVDAETTHRHPDTGRVDSRVMSVAETSELPDDHDNPSARSDYYDHMTTGMDPGVWADEDSGSWSGEKKAPGAALPGVMKNETSMDDFLGALGNYWSGYETEDVSGPQGFPTEDFSENVDYDRSDLQGGGRVLASGRGKMNQRQATNIELVGKLAQDFLKEFGKKDLTRRHVMAFLQQTGNHGYLVSDVIRCLKLRHSVFVKDVLDEFPVVKTASDGRSSLAAMRDKLIQLEVASVLQPEVSFQFRRCAASLSVAIADLERLEGRHG